MGLSIIKGGNISTGLLNVNFLLWGNEDPNSSWEQDQYLQEKEDECTHISRKHPQKSYLQALRSSATYSDPTPRSNGSPPPRDSSSNLAPSAPARSSGMNAINGNFNAPNAGSSHVQNSFCVRCLLSGHNRPSCTNRIKCRSCKCWGHIARDCFSSAQHNPPPRSNSAARLAIEFPRQDCTVPAIVTTHPSHQLTNRDHPVNAPPLSTPIRSHHCRTSQISTTQRLQAAVIQPSSPPLNPSSPTLRSSSSMATFPFDPTPFIPPNHQSIQVEGRPARV